MKRNVFVILMLLLLVPIGFVGCSSDSDDEQDFPYEEELPQNIPYNEEAPLVGKWKLVKHVSSLDSTEIQIKDDYMMVIREDRAFYIFKNGSSLHHLNYSLDNSYMSLYYASANGDLIGYGYIYYEFSDNYQQLSIQFKDPEGICYIIPVDYGTSYYKRIK